MALNQGRKQQNIAQNRGGAAPEQMPRVFPGQPEGVPSRRCFCGVDPF
jgi:hypothetical protein